MKKIGILHLSDIHVQESAISSIDEIISKLVKDISQVVQERKTNIQLVCFAGDMIQSGAEALCGEQQLKLAEDHFIDPLLKQLDLAKDRFILVPGNHEVNRSLLVEMTEKGLASLNGESEINDIINNMEDEYKKRINYFYEYLSTNFLPDAQIWNVGFSIKRFIEDIEIGIVGIDSAWRSSGKGDEEFGNMIVGASQVKHHYETIKDADLKICIMHHPVNWLKKEDAKTVEKELCKFDLVLQGHVHDLEDKQILTKRYKSLFNVSGKLFPQDEFYCGYSIIDIDYDAKLCDVISREYYPSPREDFDKALRINDDGIARYQLASFNSEEQLENDLRIQLKDYFENVIGKQTMLKSFDSISGENINDYFVSPVFYERDEFEREKDEINREVRELGKEKEAEKTFSLIDIVNSQENYLIVGNRESGKTSVLRAIGLQLASGNDHRIPVYIDMLNLSSGSDRILKECRNFIISAISNDFSFTKKDVDALLNNGKVVCLIDNINISDSNHIFWLQKFTNLYTNCRFIITTEKNPLYSYGIKELPDLGIPVNTCFIDSFNKRQVRELITKWGQGKKDFDVNSMTNRIVNYCNNVQFSMTPFNIAVFLTIWEVDNSFVPVNEGKVMRTYLETVLDKLNFKSVQRSEFDFDIKQHFLGFLAWKMYEKDEYYFSTDEFNAVVSEYHDLQGYNLKESKFDIIFKEKNILYQSGDLVFFSNTSVMEYCLAYYSTIDNSLHEKMLQSGLRGLFIHELSFYTGIKNDCTNMLEKLSEELVDILKDNLYLLDEIDKITIDLDLKTDKESIKKSLIDNRKSIEELDKHEESATRVDPQKPTEITKKSSERVEDSFFILLIIYGNALKNAETLTKEKKKKYMRLYILGMDFLFGIFIRHFSDYLQQNDTIPPSLKNEFPDITEKEFGKTKKITLELIKLALPASMQIMISSNIGTPKLDVVVEELFNEPDIGKFTQFMLAFLYFDVKNGTAKSFLLQYIQKEESKDILKLIYIKLIYCYENRYYGVNSQVDDNLLELIAITASKLEKTSSNSKGLGNDLAMIKSQLRRELTINPD